MDAFYASVEVRDRPELSGKPVLVGGSPRGRGVVAAASYEARQFGIHSAMPASSAKRLCPHAIFLQPRHDYYAELSGQIRDILDRYTPLVEPLALDEAFLDVTASRNLWGEGPDIGHAIKHEIREELRLVASVGVAPNKFLAKLASDFDKPDGFVVIQPEHVQDFLDPLPISRLWGVGKSTDRVLTELGVATIAQLRGLPQRTLERQLGEWGHHFWQLAHGIDNRPVVNDRESKSISHETTFERDINDIETLKSVLLELTEQVAYRLRGHQRRARTVEIKVRFADFTTITRSKRLIQSTDVTKHFWQTAERLLVRALQNSSLAVRLLGIGVSTFDHDSDKQLELFKDNVEQKQSKLDSVADQIQDRFGVGTIHRGWGTRD
jgi:DNA polymerase-4